MVTYDRSKKAFLVANAGIEAIKIKSQTGKTHTIALVNGGFEVHNGYLLEDKEMTTNGRRHHRLAIVTWLGNKIIVRRYNRTGEISCQPPLYWVEKETVTF